MSKIFCVSRVWAAYCLAFTLLVGVASAQPDTEPTDTESTDTESTDTESTDTESTTRNPEAVIDALNATLLSVMKNAENLGYQGRFDALSHVLPELFDISFMAQKSIGRYWKRADEEMRTHLLETFTEFTIANYAGNFDGYSGETFETLNEVASTHGTVIVNTRLKESNGNIIELNYRLRQVGGEWKIIDVYLNGTVSELALRRSEYSALIEREGFDSLIVALNQKITDLSE